MAEIQIGSKVKTTCYAKDLFMICAKGEVVKKKRPYTVRKGTVGTVHHVYNDNSTNDYQIAFDKCLITLNKKCVELV